MGFLSFWGLFWLVRRVFSGSGFFWFLGLLAFLRFGRGGWGAGCRGVFSGSGLGAPGSCSLWGWGSGASGASGSCALCGGWVRVCAWFLLPVGVGVGCVCVSGSFLGCGFRGWVGRPGSCVLCGGWVCLVSCFVFAVFFGRVRGGVSGCFCFRSALPSSGLGGVGLGWGCFFSGCSARSGLVSGSGVGFVWRV